MDLISILEQKRKLLAHKEDLISKLSTNPRESIKSALEIELGKLDQQILNLDKQFLIKYNEFSQSLPKNSKNNIDTSSLSVRQKEIIKSLQNIISEDCFNINK